MSRPLVGLLGVLSMYLAISAQPAGAAELSMEQQQAFAWYDTLGFPDTKGSKWVRVATGHWYKSGNHPPVNQYKGGFLLKDDGETFVVFTPALLSETYKKTPPATAEHERVFYEERPLADAAAELLKALQHPPEPDDPQTHWLRFGERLSQRAEVFMFARSCARNGLVQVASELYAQAVALPRYHDEPSGGGQSFVRVLSQDISHALIWQHILAFGDPLVPRTELLRRFQHLVTHFPSSTHAGRAKETAALLQRMVAEDAAHKPAASSSPTERVAELIWQLRDQNGHQWSQPGACDIFSDPRGEKSPADQLVKLGYAAVPQLIEVIEDQRFTRSVGYHRDFHFSHHVLRVGDAALDIISRIAGRAFYVGTYTNAAMIKDGQQHVTQLEIKKWWAAFQQQGEKGMLMRATEVGDSNAAEQAGRLVEKYPEAAFAPIRTGASRAKESWTRSALVELAAKLLGSGASSNKELLAFLRTELQSGPFLRSRIAAARGLHAAGEPAALAAMISEWRKLPAPPADSADDDSGELISFLAASNRPAAIEALAQELRSRPVNTRLAVVEGFLEARSYSMMATGSGAAMPAATAGESEPSARAIEKLLIDALDDTEERTGMSGTIDDKTISDPRICDMAGHVLFKRWPTRYTFDLNASRAGRERQRIALQNVWRQLHHLPALPLPQPRAVPKVEASRLRPLLDRLGRATTDGERTAAGAAIEALGVGALPAVREELGRLPPTAGARPALSSLAQRLGSVVTEVRTEPPAQPLPTPLASLVAALLGKPLTSEGFLGLLVAFAREPTAAGMRLHADRDTDGSGISVQLRFVTHKPAAAPATTDSWSTSERVNVGNDCIYNSSGSSSADYVRNLSSFAALGKSIDKALQSAPEIALELRASLIR